MLRIILNSMTIFGLLFYSQSLKFEKSNDRFIARDFGRPRDILQELKQTAITHPDIYFDRQIPLILDMIISSGDDLKFFFQLHRYINTLNLQEYHLNVMTTNELLVSTIDSSFAKLNIASKKLRFLGRDDLEEIKTVYGLESFAKYLIESDKR